MRGLLRELRKRAASWRIEASRALLRGVRGVSWRSACVTAARWLWRAALVPSLWGFSRLCGLCQGAPGPHFSG